jgi:hypothetical protein
MGNCWSATLATVKRRLLRSWCGAMVQWYGVSAAGVLCNQHDAEDAFRATFLALVRKAASIASRALIANKLYGVAQQTWQMLLFCMSTLMSVSHPCGWYIHLTIATAPGIFQVIKTGRRLDTQASMLRQVKTSWRCLSSGLLCGVSEPV